MRLRRWRLWSLALSNAPHLVYLKLARTITFLGGNDFVDSTIRFVYVAVANEKCCGDEFNSYNNNTNCYNSYSRRRNK